MHQRNVMGEEMGNELPGLIDHKSPEEIRKEVKMIWDRIFPGDEDLAVNDSFDWIVSLFRGEVEGYRGCNTDYHDLAHTTDTYLVLARMLHGASVDGVRFEPRFASLALCSALFHDSGYIQAGDDKEGTGAKYTKIHVDRSVELLRRYAKGAGWGDGDDELASMMIRATDISVDLDDMKFENGSCALMAKLLAGADLLAQMSDRAYLEKLLYLYYELREGGIKDFRSEADLLKKTVDFYRFVDRRMKDVMTVCDRYLRLHFKSRWGVEENLYWISIERQRDYLMKVLALSEDHPQVFLRRDGIVDKVREKYGS